MSNSRLTYLFEQYLAKACTETERNELAVMILSSKHDDDVKALLQHSWDTIGANQDMSEERAAQIIDSILYQDPKSQVRKMYPWKRMVAAASILILVSFGGYFIFKNMENQNIAKTEPQETRFKNDVAAPVGTKATIILADGTTVSIDSLTTLTQNGVSLTKTTDGKIIYDGSAKEMAYNTLSNPRGSKVIDMTLADGSHVWLNAGSSVTYPLAFIGEERKVSITGEAYFEVAHNPAMPFKVSKGEMQVTVLGTHFNVNAYDDEQNIKVTLLEGSVKVSKGSLSGMLKPGQQAQIDGTIRLVDNANLDQVMAWKNGLFSFNKADIKAIMKEIARWYDVEVIYTTDVKETFYLKASRNISVSNIFKILETTGGVHLEIEGKKIIVKP